MDECLKSCKRFVQDMRPVKEVDNLHGDGTESRDMDEVSSKRRRSSINGSGLLNAPSPSPSPSTNLNSMNMSSSPANSTTSSENTILREQSGDVVINGFRSTDLKV